MQIVNNPMTYLVYLSRVTALAEGLYYALQNKKEKKKISKIWINFPCNGLSCVYSTAVKPQQFHLFLCSFNLFRIISSRNEQNRRILLYQIVNRVSEICTKFVMKTYSFVLRWSMVVLCVCFHISVSS